METALLDVPGVLHGAGPFTQIFKLMVEACLKTKTRYLDITGVEVFEAIAALDAEAKTAGVMLMPGVPGVSFDVVPQTV